MEPNTEHQRLIRRLLDSSKKAEALDWLKGDSQGGRRELGEFKKREPAVAFVETLYRLGANEVLAVDIDSDKGGNQRTGKLVVVLPKNVQAREAIFKWCQVQVDSLGFSPEQDGGEEHLFLLLD